MALVELAGRTREDKGKGAAHRLRAEGLLPGVVYGPQENLLVAVERHTFEGVLRKAATGTVLIDLALPGSTYKVLIKEVQRDPISSLPLHVDFLHISMDRPIRLDVPVRLEGVPEGVKTEGGMLEHVLREVEVECLPSDVPEFIELDVTPLAVGQALHVRDLALERIRVLTPGDRVIASVHGRAAEVAEAAAPVEGEAAAPAEGAEAKAEEKSGAEKKPAADKKGAEKEGKGA